MWTISKEVQEKLIPEQVITMLEEGNKRFINNLKLNRNLLQQVNETSNSQYPFAVILSCMDSRTSAELIFDQSLGDIFSIRIAGNILNEDILGSIEFACKVAGAKLIVVLGHTKCAAVSGAAKGIKMGHLTTLLNKFKPVLEAEENQGTVDLNSLAEANVKLTLNRIGKESAIIKEMLDAKQIGIIGGMYDVETGKVEFYK